MYLDGELDSQEQARVAAHLAACPACRDEMASLQALFVALDDLAAGPALDLVPSVLSRVHPHRRPALAWLVPAAQGIAALALLGAGVAQLSQHWDTLTTGLAPADGWNWISDQLVGLWTALSTWPQATWDWICRWIPRLTIPGGGTIPLLQLVILATALGALWVAGNALLLLRATRNGQVNQRRH